MSAVMQLRYEEAVRLDRDQIEVLYRQLGPVGADKVVNQALEELAATLGRAMRAYREVRLEELQMHLRTLIAVARQVGMTALARVARDVLDLTSGRDGAALGATMARLERIGEGSLVAVWDLQDLSV